MDIEKVKELLALMESHDLAELEIEEQGSKIRLKKHRAIDAELPPIPTPIPSMLPPSMPGSMSSSPREAVLQPAPEQETEKLHKIVSPMVGTFYRAPSPDSAPFVSVGDSVKEDTIICIIEAMKVMNEIKAEVEGEIVKILVENGEAVEYGQPLMLVRPARPSGA